MHETAVNTRSEIFPTYTLHVYGDPQYTWTRKTEPLGLSFAFSPRESFDLQSCFLPTRVRPQKTPWADSWNREEVVRNMDVILRSNGVESSNARVRMIAHAVVASGWRQNVWNYNAWGVQQGSWQGSFFLMPTEEVDSDGNPFRVEDAAWRSFRNWSEAIDDFHARIHPESNRPSYRKAYQALISPKTAFRADAAYWEALGEGNYYTAVQFTGTRFAMLCNSVREMLESVSS